MAYYTGTVNDMPALRQALIDACLLEGWAWNGSTDVLSKGALFLRVQVVSGYLTFLGRTSATAGDAPEVCRIGTTAGVSLVWPMTYEVFAFPGEVYLVVNFGVSYYQWAAFGLSTVQGMPGSGMWLGATGGAAAASNCNITAVGGGLSGSSVPALFHGTQGAWNYSRTAWVHSDLDGQGWWLAQTLTGTPVGAAAAAPLLGLLPSAWNSEAVLLPIRAYKVRASNRISLIADLEHARQTRIDHYAPGQIITIGSERWKIFPWFVKNTTWRNGGTGTHTGTFGWAIRYEGP